ncbi:MarR family transcriptional regulator [Weissella cibaria]|uniref:MarR family transcriptional regulator n=1 Tax=Weissella TaxID=46255 RepID=UPI00107F6DA9|nr:MULTISPECIES: helix-turn-helix domain-containing protein [Weissella]MDQ2126776.1 MarR family transcriptional regulator [Weissella cibaria]MDQ2158766.1 MarR family transcriptional regulator [Weissella cibaria]TGE62930.1 MarR family transcriptional regulator [Weissella confusa]
MSENLKTIRELADELGVSKQRIQQIIAKLSPSKTPNKDGNRYVLNARDVKNIKESMGFENDKSPTSESTNRLVDYDVYLDVINSIKEKDEQIKSLLDVQKQTQNLLDQQQRLALQDKKLLEEYKAEIKDLKSLAMPIREDEKDVSPQSETEPAEAQAKPKKWWQFKKRGQKND